MIITEYNSEKAIHELLLCLASDSISEVRDRQLLQIGDIMQLPKIAIDENKIADIALKFQIQELYLFGSVLRDDFNAQSDIDILLVFKENVSYSFFELYDLKEKLEALFSRKIDLVEKKGLKNPYRRKEILSTARKIYATA